MLNKRFCFLAGTGRAATHWFYMLFNKYCDKAKVAPFHDGLMNRLKAKGRFSPGRCLTNYALNLMMHNQTAETYIECNPAFLEYVALSYGVKTAANVIPPDLFAHPTPSLFIVRHPVGYAESLKAKGWGWEWWKLPFANDVYDLGGWGKMGQFGKIGKAWAVKNKFFTGLLDAGDCITLDYDEFFGLPKADYLEKLHAVFEHFGIVPLVDDDALWKLKNEKAAVKNKNGVKLTPEERRAVLAQTAIVRNQPRIKLVMDGEIIYE